MTTPSPEEFAKVRADAETFYKEIGSVHSPYFSGPVAFNAKGLDHLKLKEWNKAREVGDQYRRLRLIHLAPEVIRQSKTVQGISFVDRFERRQVNSRWEMAMTRITYYEFIAVLKNVRIRVIVKKLEGGHPFFWSVMPFWKDSTTGRRKMSYGNPETD